MVGWISVLTVMFVDFGKCAVVILKKALILGKNTRTYLLIKGHYVAELL